MNLKSIILVLITYTGVVFAQNELQWRVLPNAPPRTTSRYDDVYFLNPLLGWVVNGTGKIYRTTDGGENWELQLDQPATYFRSIGFADSLRGWAGNFGLIEGFARITDSTPLYQTVNSGRTWRPVLNIPAPKPEGICGIWVASDSIVYATGRIFGAPRVLKTEDVGKTWTTFDMSNLAGHLVDIYFFSPDSGFVVGGVGNLENSRGRVLFTADGGQTWTIRHTTKPNAHWGWKISFPTRMIGYVSLETYTTDSTSYFLKTTDGGETWEEMLLFGGYREQGMAFLTPDLGWVGGAGQTYQTTDGGATWQLIDLFFAAMNRFRFLSDTLGYAVGRTVFKYSRENITSVSEAVTEIPGAYRLGQNYPNPFNPTSTITYQLRTAGFVTVTVYDLLGKKVRTLVNRYHLEGDYSVTLDGNDLASGVYFYRLQAGGDFADTKKMVLMK